MLSPVSSDQTLGAGTVHISDARVIIDSLK